jgi:Domain of unknown function (DUF222)
MNTPPPSSSDTTSLRSGLASAAAEFDSVLRTALAEGGLRSTSDDDLLTLLASVEAAGRKVDALRVAAAAEVSERSRRSLGSEGLAARKGCRNGNELIRRTTLVTSGTAARWINLGTATRARDSLTGAIGTSRFPAVANAFAFGTIGLDSASAIIDGLTPIEGRSRIDAREAAERELVGAATGLTPEMFDSRLNDSRARDSSSDREDSSNGDPGLPSLNFENEGDFPGCSADETRLQALVWRAVLDPDGVEPAEERAMAKRGVRLGRERDGVVRISGNLIAPAAAQLQKLFHAYANPRIAPAFAPNFSDSERSSVDLLRGHSSIDGPNDEFSRDGRSNVVETAVEAGLDPDDRNRDQRQHDAFASIIDHAARCAKTPTSGGAAPAVIVTVSEQALSEDAVGGGAPGTAISRKDRRHSVGFVEGVENPVSVAAIARHACAGGIQRVTMNANGAIVQLSSPQRCFTPQQRRMITVRDGGCIIPGCGIPASWCEVHHVREHARGGQTHTDNGVLLCWFHHRTLESSGWLIRMNGGSPEIKAPPWIASSRAWQPAANAPRQRFERYRRLLEEPDEEAS